MTSTRDLRFGLTLILLGVLCSSSYLPASPQTKGSDFEDPDGMYSLTLPPGWQAITSRDGLGRTEVNIVHQVRENAALKIRRITVEPGTKAMEQAVRDENQSLRFLPGYVKGTIENFAAASGAALVTYDFTSGGRPMMGRNYYLLVNETTIYLLRFTGTRNTLGPLRNQTDAIARSFKGR